MVVSKSVYFLTKESPSESNSWLNSWQKLTWLKLELGREGRFYPFVEDGGLRTKSLGCLSLFVFSISMYWDL